MAFRKYIALSRSLATGAGSSRSIRNASSDRAATAGGSEFEKRYVRLRWRSSLDQGLRARHEAAGRGAHRLAERPVVTGTSAEDALLLGGAAAGLARGRRWRASRPPRAWRRASRRSARTRAGPLLAFHREDAVGDVELEARGLVFAEHPIERREVAVRRAEPLRLGQPHAVDDRGVVELVRVEPVGLLQHGGEEALVRGPAGHVQDRVVASEEGRDLGFELLVQLLRAADEPHRPEPRAPAVDRLLLRFPDARVVREAQVVVRGQHHDLAPADLHARPLRRLQDELFLVRARLFSPAICEARCSTKLVICRPARESCRPRDRPGTPRPAPRARGRTPPRCPRHDFRAERRRAHELRSPRRAAHDDRVHRVLDDEEDPVDLLERPGRDAVRLLDLVLHAGTRRRGP